MKESQKNPKNLNDRIRKNAKESEMKSRKENERI